MTKSLADLRAKPPVGRPLKSMTICLAPEIISEVQRLTVEHDQLLALVPPAPAAVEDDSDGDRPPTRVGGESRDAKREREEAQAKVDEVRDRLAALLDEMAEFEGELTLRANLSDGEWRRWTNANPARAEGEPGHDRDERVTGGYCNADALIDEVATYVHQWNGEHVTASDWTDLFEAAIVSADKATMATYIVSMYESRLDFQRLRSGLSASLKRLNDSSSPAPSESPTNASTAGSPASSTSTPTTTRAVSPVS